MLVCALGLEANLGCCFSGAIHCFILRYNFIGLGLLLMLISTSGLSLQPHIILV